MNIHEAKTHFSKVLERAAAGEDVVISRAGVPIAVVVGIERYKPQREFGFAAGAFRMAPLEEFNSAAEPDTVQYFTAVDGE